MVSAQVLKNSDSDFCKHLIGEPIKKGRIHTYKKNPTCISYK